MSRSWSLRSPGRAVIEESVSNCWEHIYRIGRKSDRWPRCMEDRDPTVRRVLDRSRGMETLVISGSGGIYGYLIWCVSGRGVRAEIVSLAVDPAYRRLRMGARLIRKMRSQVVARGVRKVLATVNEHDDAAIAFLASRAVGMRAIGVMREYYGNDDGYRFVIDSEKP